MRFRSQSREFFEAEIANERFSLRTVYKHLARIEASEAPLEVFKRLGERLGPATADATLQGLLRAVFFIELVKVPKIDSTKFALRWADSLESSGDPRFSSYEECLSLFETLAERLDSALVEESNGEMLRAFNRHHLLPYEIPLDYSQRRLVGRMHVADNLMWAWDDLARRVVGLRAFLLDPKTNPQAAVFSATYDKIKVKTYLTDRVLTGDFKTNREKRWEIHPASVHFALRRECWDIEATLIRQICHFDGFPEEVAQGLEAAGLIEWGARPFRCPVTLEPLHFGEFLREITTPTSGKSSFQVGHLNPLKALSGEAASGHAARNISWISSEGNRIQGALSLEQTRDLIRRIADNYRATGLG